MIAANKYNTMMLFIWNRWVTFLRRKGLLNPAITVYVTGMNTAKGVVKRDPCVF